MSQIATVEKMQPPAETRQSGPVNMLDALMRVVSDPQADPTRFEWAINMHERLQAREAKRLYDEAMSQMQPALPIIGERGKTNTGTYAKWDDINEQIKPILVQHGFSLTHRAHQNDGKISVTCIVSHRDGHREETTLSGAPDKSGSKNEIQAIGSSLSYLQRYSAKLLLNLTSRLSEDDDGRAAGPAQKPAISAEQVKLLRDAIGFRDIPEERALKRFKVESLEEIYAVDFDACMRVVAKTGGDNDR